jgi:phosphoglycolate phosphatase
MSKRQVLPIVLFDIDGTVLTFDGSPPGPGRTALEGAMRELYAFERATEGLRVAGGTDRALARALLRRASVEANDTAIELVIASYLRHLEAVLEARAYRPVGDVAGAVRELREGGAVIGLGTGNVRAGAQLKLASAGLSATFHLEHGGFGCDAEPRADILRKAIERCANPARPVAPVVVVGDTEHDVRAGHAVGARVVGVAKDDEAREELRNAGADAIVDTCGDALVREVFSLARAP